MEEAELFHLLVKNAKGLAIFTLDAQGRVASWNESARMLLGYEGTDILGRPFDVLFIPEDREKGDPEQGAPDRGSPRPSER
ncbi:PAS domain-containing protein [Candidatus Nitrospira bockiana]